MRDEIYTLITGATKGIGYELAKIIGKDGKNLFLVARNEDELRKIKKEMEEEFKIKVDYRKVDLSNNVELEKFLIDLDNYNIETIINNAGIGSFGYFDEIDEKKDEMLINLNIKAPTTIIKRLLPKMKKRGHGAIINIASTAAFVGGPKMSTYYSSKAYILTLTEALYEECKGFGVKVSCICPGPVKTEFQREAGIVKSEKAKKYLMSAKVVAEEGYNRFKKGKVIIIPGFKNKVMVLGTKLLPRCIIRKIIFKTNS
ncbi:MAG: SDR family NAD(P)-dependent oxidoreductase [Clostridium sp.]|uniref:SDR family NAD(P)-dependent oxidoreductase n=1 Tax=Clostridium sp. TaxID=1506 RepID=UPI003EE72E30